MEFLACFLHFPLCLLHKGNTEEENNGYTSSFYEISTYQLGRWVVVRDANATSFCSIVICIDDVNCFSSISDTCFIAPGVFYYKPYRFFLCPPLFVYVRKKREHLFEVLADFWYHKRQDIHSTDRGEEGRGGEHCALERGETKHNAL